MASLGEPSPTLVVEVAAEERHAGAAREPEHGAGRVGAGPDLWAIKRRVVACSFALEYCRINASEFELPWLAGSRKKRFAFSPRRAAIDLQTRHMPDSASRLILIFYGCDSAVLSYQ